MKSQLIKAFVIIVLIFSNETSIAQLNLKEHVWSKDEAKLQLPDSLKNYDAIIVHQRQDIKNYLDLSSGSVTNYITIKSRVKINTQKGLDDLSTISFYKNKYRKITKLDARTIKKDGSIVDLKSADIKILDIKTDKNRSNFEVIRFSVPGVQIGDELEYIYTLETNSLYTSADIFMHNSLPTMKAEFAYTTDNSLYTEFRMYNDMPDPVISRSVNDAKFVWTLTNLQGLGDERRHNLTETLPFIRFALRQVIINGMAQEGLARYGITKNDWAEIYDNYTNTYKNVNFEDNYKGMNAYTYLKKLKPMLDTMSIDSKLSYFINYVNDSLKIVDDSDISETLPLSNYIYNKKINESNLHNFIRYFLKFYEIKYYVGFGRDRIDGNLDLQFATSSMITDIIYVFENENQDIHFIYPSNSVRKYQIDELPYHITGTDIVIVNRPSDNSLKSIVNKINVPMNPYNANARNRMSSVQVDLKSKKCNLKTKESLLGDFSTTFKTPIYRSLEDEKKNESFKSNYSISDNVNIDTFAIDNYKKIYPYNLNLIYQGDILLDIQEVEKGVYSIPLLGLIDHFKFNTDDADITLNYYCPFKYIDNQKIYLQFSQPVEILTNDVEKLWVIDEVGNYILNFSKVNDKMILVESKLDIRKDKLNPNQYKTLNRINESVKNSNQSRLLVKSAL